MKTIYFKHSLFLFITLLSGLSFSEAFATHEGPTAIHAEDPRSRPGTATAPKATAEPAPAQKAFFSEGIQVVEDMPGELQHEFQTYLPGDAEKNFHRALAPYPLECSGFLGGGTYGIVQRCASSRLPEKPFAIKVMLLRDGGILQRGNILEEQILSEVQRRELPNLMGRHKELNSFTFDKYLFVPLPLASTSLKEFIANPKKYAQKPIDLPDLMRQVVSGVRSFHQLDLCHRDLKPANILVTVKAPGTDAEETVVEIGDYGMAKKIPDDGSGKKFLSLDPRTLKSRKSHHLGTLMSPSHTPGNSIVTLWYRAFELLLQGEEYDSSIDIFSTGAILMEMILGTPLFPSRDETDQVQKLIAFYGTDKVKAHIPAAWLPPLSDKFFLEKRRPQHLLLMLEASERFKSLDPAQRAQIKSLLPGIKAMLELDPQRRTIDHAFPHLEDIVDSDEDESLLPGGLAHHRILSRAWPHIIETREFNKIFLIDHYSSYIDWFKVKAQDLKLSPQTFHSALWIFNTHLNRPNGISTIQELNTSAQGALLLASMIHEYYPIDLAVLSPGSFEQKQILAKLISMLGADYHYLREDLPHDRLIKIKNLSAGNETIREQAELAELLLIMLSYSPPVSMNPYDIAVALMSIAGHLREGTIQRASLKGLEKEIFDLIRNYYGDEENRAKLIPHENPAYFAPFAPFLEVLK